jgi:hypothetical protein
LSSRYRFPRRDLIEAWRRETLMSFTRISASCARPIYSRVLFAREIAWIARVSVRISGNVSRTRNPDSGVGTSINHFDYPLNAIAWGNTSFHNSHFRLFQVQLWQWGLSFLLSLVSSHY